MQLPRGSGLEYLDKIVRRSLDYYSEAFEAFKADGFRLPSICDPAKGRPAVEIPSLNSLTKPLESFMKGLSSAVAHFSAKPKRVDYKAVVSTFLPPGAKLLKPQHPGNASEIQFADLDGDGLSELVASYRTNEGIKTLILHKDAVQWYRMAEIGNPGFDEIHYRNSADMTGNGKQHLLLGLGSKSGGRTLFAYSPDNDNARMIFSKNYHMLELVKARSTSRGSSRPAVALWNEEASGIYDIDLVAWNGLELETLDNRRYLAGKVIPYYMRKLRQNPDDSAVWYNLANAMSRTGNRSYAETAVKIGLDHNPDELLREKFNTLKSRL